MMFDGVENVHFRCYYHTEKAFIRYYHMFPHRNPTVGCKSLSSQTCGPQITVREITRLSISRGVPEPDLLFADDDRKDAPRPRDQPYADDKTDQSRQGSLPPRAHAPDNTQREPRHSPTPTEMFCLTSVESTQTKENPNQSR